VSALRFPILVWHYSSLSTINSTLGEFRSLALLSNSYSKDPLSLVIFGIHLGLLGYLIYGSGCFTGIIRTLLAIDGLGGVIDNLTPYPYPNAHLGFIFITFFGELIFMLWLSVWGWTNPGADRAA